MSQEKVEANQDKVTTAGIIAAVILTGISLWVGSIQSNIKDVTALKPQIIQLRKDVDDNTAWQKDWQSNGELPADVRQTKDIEYLSKTLDELKEKVNDLEKLLNNLKLNQAENN